MSTSEQRLAANRANGLKSTGPNTVTGKDTASRNATRHGLLSARLFLEDEDPENFAALESELREALRPVDTIELALVERIAIGMWRQRRFVGAETAAIELGRRPHEIASAASGICDPALGGRIDQSDLAPFCEVQAKWCRDVISEIEAIEEVTLSSVETNAPLSWRQLATDAESDNETVEEHITAYRDGLIGYLAELDKFCRVELSKAEQRPHLLKLAQSLKDRRLVLNAAQLELFSRYQTTLDNQLFKALRALREAQEWRLKTLDHVPARTSDQDLSDAA